MPKQTTKAAVTEKSPVKKSALKKAPVKKTPVEKAAVKNAPVKKASAKKASVKKSAVKKAPVKKAAVEKATVMKAVGMVPAPPGAKQRAALVHERLAETYPEAICELDHTNPFELLVATILSAQCTDARVNLVTPTLFAKYPSPAALAAADRAELEEMIRPTGFFRNKATSLLGMASSLVANHHGEVPGDMDLLTALPGVGRKTANVVRSVALGLPGLAVDTHVGRLARRLGLTNEEDPVRVELELNEMVPADERGAFSLRIILHGRRVCAARKPQCNVCSLADFCPSAGR